MLVGLLGPCWPAPAAARDSVAPAATTPVAKSQAVRRIKPLDPLAAPPAPLMHTKTGQRLSLQLFDDRGRIQLAELARARDYLACHKTGNDHPMHWRLLSLVQAIAAHWPGRRIEIISGYRHPSVSLHARRSNHTRGRALDLRVRGVENHQLVDTLRASFTDIGIGYYPNSHFVHLDVRSKPSLWLDFAGPGQKPCYSRSPSADLKNGRAEGLDYAQAIKRGCRR